MVRRLIARKNLLKITVGICALAAITLAFALREVRGSDAHASHAQDFGDSIAALTNAGSETAATVNGVPISMGKVKAYMVFSATGKKLGQVSFDGSVRQYVDSLIESELLFQEAQRRNLVPSDVDVEAYAKQNKAGLLEYMNQDTPEAKGLREVFAQVKGTPYGIDAYEGPVMLDSFRHTLAIGAVRTAISDELPPADVKDRAKRDAHVNAVLSELKSNAKIEVNPLP